MFHTFDSHLTIHKEDSWYMKSCDQDSSDSVDDFFDFESHEDMIEEIKTRLQTGSNDDLSVCKTDCSILLL